MTDNLLELIAMQPDIIVSELIQKTKDCSLTWDQITHTTYSTKFLWKSVYYDVYVTQIHNGYVLDVLKNKRKAFNLNSYLNDRVQVLHSTISDTLKTDASRQIIQDLNSLTPCVIAPKAPQRTRTGGLKAGGSAIEYVSYSANVRLYMSTNLIGGSVQSLYDSGQIHTLLTNRKNIKDIIGDTDRQKIFWTQNERNSETKLGCSLFCCDLNGNNVQRLLNFDDYNSIPSIALDKANQHIYFTLQKKLIANNDDESYEFPVENAVYHVRRCDYDGANIFSVADGNTYICSPVSLAVDSVNQRVYWCDALGLSEGYIYRANFDTTGAVILLGTLGYVRAIFVYGDYLYVGGNGVFYRMDLNAENVEYLANYGYSIIQDMTIYGDKVYFLDTGVNKIICTDLDGTNVEYLANDYISGVRIGAK